MTQNSDELNRQVATNRQAELNRQWCQGTQEFAEQKLGRPLTQEESDKIWNTGSFLQLEQIDMAIYYATSPSQIEEFLANLSPREPLSKEYTRRFDP